MADTIRCIYSLDEGYFCTKHSNAFYDASCRLLDGESCEDQKPTKPITNADKLRSMTDEELAEWMAKYNNEGINFCPNFGAHDCQATCENCWLDWLKQEVTDG